jgi:thioredoxin-like negative regulator of GroEL
MSAESPLIQTLRSAVAAAPDDVPLRLHLAELLLTAGHSDAAVAEAAVALQHAPADAQARGLMVRAMGGPATAPSEAPAAPLAPGSAAAPTSS